VKPSRVQNGFSATDHCAAGTGAGNVGTHYIGTYIIYVYDKRYIYILCTISLQNVSRHTHTHSRSRIIYD